MRDGPCFHNLTLGNSIQVQLLASRPYSGSDPVRMYTLGMALARQTGVHAIGSDRREDFDTWPGTLAYTPPGVDVFSESASGGEYLVLRWASDELQEAVGNFVERT